MTVSQKASYTFDLSWQSEDRTHTSLHTSLPGIISVFGSWGRSRYMFAMIFLKGSYWMETCVWCMLISECNKLLAFQNNLTYLIVMLMSVYRVRCIGDWASQWSSNASTLSKFPPGIFSSGFFNSRILKDIKTDTAIKPNFWRLADFYFARTVLRPLYVDIETLLNLGICRLWMCVSSTWHKRWQSTYGAKRDSGTSSNFELSLSRRHKRLKHSERNCYHATVALDASDMAHLTVFEQSPCL